MREFYNIDNTRPTELAAMPSFAREPSQRLQRQPSIDPLEIEVPNKGTALSRHSSVDSRTRRPLPVAHKLKPIMSLTRVPVELPALGPTISESLTLSRQVSKVSKKPSGQNVGNLSRQSSLKHLPKLPPHEVAFEMIENNRLDIKRLELQTMTSQNALNLFKLFVASLVYIRHRGEIRINYSADLENFVQEVNQKLGSPEVKRPDDRLRWVYKKFINQTLMDMTEYRPTKNFRKEKYIGTLVDEFFPTDKQYGQMVLNDSTFASKKRIKEMFQSSKTFKRAFKRYSSASLIDVCRSEFITDFIKMYRQLASLLEDNPKKKKDLDSLLFQTHKRLPWRCEDVLATIQQVNEIN